MSDLNFNISDANKPSDKQVSDLTFAAQSLQVGAKEMQAIAGKTTDAVTAVGFASADQLLAGFSEAEQASSSRPEPADKQDLLTQMKKAYARDTSPQAIEDFLSDKPSVTPQKFKEIMADRIAGQEQIIAQLNPKQLQVVADLADAIKRNDDKAISKILQDIPADITGRIAFVAQYQLQLEGVNKIGVEARNENGKGYLLIKDGNTHMQEKFDRVTGQHLGFTSMEIPM